MKLISDESTLWYLPSKQVTFTSTTGKPNTPPCSIVSTTPFSTAGMNWRGIAPPTIWSTNSKPAPAVERLHPHERDAELAVPAGLLLVLALGLGRAGDRLAVRDLHVLGLDLDAELAVQPLERDAEVRLAHAPQQRLVRLGVALEAQRRVLVEQAVQRVGELVLVALRLGVDRDREHGLRRGERLDVDSAPRAPSTSPVVVSVSLATAAMSPAGTSGDRLLVLAAHHRELVQALLAPSCGR